LKILIEYVTQHAPQKGNIRAAISDGHGVASWVWEIMIARTISRRKLLHFSVAGLYPKDSIYVLFIAGSLGERFWSCVDLEV